MLHLACLSLFLFICWSNKYIFFTSISVYFTFFAGLPSTGSWQDLKDHMRAAGDVCYADVYRDCTGVVEYVNEDDMRYAVKNLDDSRFRSHEVMTFS